MEAKQVIHTHYRQNDNSGLFKKSIKLLIPKLLVYTCLSFKGKAPTLVKCLLLVQCIGPNICMSMLMNLPVWTSIQLHDHSLHQFIAPIHQKTIFLHLPFVGWGGAAYYRRKTCNLMHTNAGTHQKLAKHVNARWWVGEKNTREGWGQTAAKGKIAYYGTLKEALYQEAD